MYTMLTNQKRAGERAVLISHTVYFVQNRFQNKVTRNKEGHFIMINVSNHQENITIPNIYALYNKTLKYRKYKRTEWKGKGDRSSVTIRDINNPLSIIARTSRQKISKDTEHFNYMINQFDLIEILEYFIQQ